MLAGEGLHVTYAKPAGDGTCSINSLRHWVFITGVAADSPARQKLAAFLAAGAFVACGWCLFQGCKLRGSRATRFLGYAQPAAHTVALKGRRLKAGAPSLQLSDSQLHERASMVAAGKWAANKCGCNGYSAIAKRLAYVSYGNVWILPLAHAALNGVVAKFWSLALSKFSQASDRQWYMIPHSKRRIMRQRGANMILTGDQGRPYRCILKYRGSWHLDDWLAWLETYSLHVVGTDILEQRMQHMWELLRKSLLHYFRLHVVGDDPTGPGSSFSPAARKAAARQLRQFATLAEQNGLVQLCTYNLHILVCRLEKQEQYRGHAAKDLELWVERSVQQLKSNVKYRTTMWPEKLFVLSMLTDDALSRLRAKRLIEGSNPLRTFDELVPAYRAKPLAGPLVDEGGDPVTKSQLLGKGAELKGDREAQVRALLGSFIHREQPHGWNRQRDPAAAALLMYTAAHKAGDEILQSRAHAAAQTRCSYMVRLRFKDDHGGGDSVHAAEVQYYVRATKVVAHQPVRTLRLAVCRVWRALERNGLLVVSTATPRFKLTAVDLNSIDSKVIMARAGQQKLHLLSYSKVSGLN